ncbi:MAG: hypothetical protein ABL866_17265, partial [Devosia sp.]
LYLKAPLRRARDLGRGLVLKPMTLLPGEMFVRWASAKSAELQTAAGALHALLAELERSWGPTGTPGNEEEIDHACKLFAQCAAHFVEIGEEAKFTSLPEGFQGVGECLAAGALFPLRRFPELPQFIRSIFVDGKPTASPHKFELVLDLPDGWVEDFSTAMQNGQKALEERGGVW